MAFCSNCGGAVADNVRFCPACGREVGSAAGDGTAYAPTQKMAPATAAGLDKNVAGLLCYPLGLITGIIFLLLEPYNRDPFVRFHAFQSIFFNIAGIVLSIAVAVIPFVGWMLSPLLALALLAVWVVLMVQAYQGNKWKLPVIGDIAEKQVGG